MDTSPTDILPTCEGDILPTIYVLKFNINLYLCFWYMKKNYKKIFSVRDKVIKNLQIYVCLYSRYNKHILSCIVHYDVTISVNRL